MTNRQTFRQLEAPSSECQSGDSPLDEWYQDVREVPIGDLEDGDLARACRQQLYLGHVVPTAVERLKANPLAGDLYDGELLAAMKSIPAEYWQADRQSSAVLASTINDSQHLWEAEELTADADELARRLSG